VAITPLVPVLAGGAPASHFAVTPALPAGIALDPATGILSGTPTGLSDPTVYTVTADTRDGAGAATVTLAVAESAPAPFSYGAAPVTARLGSALAGLAPAFADGGGPATGFAISPALPAGLTFSTATGILAGTPTTPSAAAVYTVTASNDAGTRSATLTLAVAAGGPGPFTYGQGILTAQVGYALAGPVPAFTGAGGHADSFSISPAPPAGLAFDTATGALSGTPGAAMAATDYTVTATNSDGSSTGTLTLAVTAATSYPRFAYVGQNDNSLAIYTVEPTTRQLRILGLADLGTITPSLLAASPDNRLLFVADQTNGFLLTFTLDPATGSPTRVPQAVLSLPGTPVQLLAGPSGTHVFVACQTRSGATVTGGSVAAFRVDSGGFLSPAAGLAPGALAAGIGPASMVVDPQGNHLVLADTANQVRALAIDANGGLTPAGAVLAGFPSPPVLAAKPAGGAICILSATGSGSAWDLAVDTYALGAGGLTPLALGTPLAQGYPQAALFDASGSQLLVSEATGPDPGAPQRLEAFTVDAGGGFASRGSLPLGSDTRAVLAEPTGHQVYALSATDDAVTLVRRTAGTGGLTRAGQVATRSGPLALALVSGALAPVHQPRFAYSFNPGDHTISGFAVDAASGALTPVAPAMPADAATDRIALHPSGTFLYQYGAASTTILASAIAADGTLSDPVSSPLPATASTGPGGFAVDPTGDYAAVTLLNDGSPHLLVYRLDHTTGGLSGLSSDDPISLDPAGSMIAFDPLDRFLYLLSENQIKAHRFDWRTGVDTVGGTADDVRPSGMDTAQAVAMTVDPTGRTVLVAVGDAGSGAVVTLVPDPTSGWPWMGSTHLGSGAGTRGLAMDPLAAYLYAACGDPAGGTPSQVFSWWLDADQALHERLPGAGGGLQDPALPSLAPGMSGVSVDPSGTFLYQVNGATGVIQVYRIDRATGALAPAGVPDVTAGPTAQPLLFVDRLQ
jgi:6-phosphogluconolactonase (cycloisomerase 2 family)